MAGTAVEAAGTAEAVGTVDAAGTVEAGRAVSSSGQSLVSAVVAGTEELPAAEAAAAGIVVVSGQIC